MANIECKDCGDLVDVEARTVTLPFVCKWCEEGFTSTPRYIIQYEGYDGWKRSGNPDACGVFDDFSVASAVAAAETDNDDSLVYRVVPYGTPDEYSESEPEPEVEPESEPESEGIEDQFELDTKLIEDLSNQLAEANKQIEIKDARIRVLETAGQSLLKDYLELLQGLENSLDYYKKIYNLLYKDFSELETRYFIERDKTWWERLWS